MFCGVEHLMHHFPYRYLNWSYFTRTPPQAEKWQEIQAQQQSFLQDEVLTDDRKRTPSLLVITRSKQGARIEN